MKYYSLANKIAAAVVFAVAMLTYGLTIEPTASFWDCPEFITTAYKMEVGHPPGAPFFMLTGKFFSLFASDATQVAKMINLLSAFLSALTILFLHLTITHLAKRGIADRDEDMTLAQAIAIIGSGVVGSLVYAFSDTFWFSAVEGEVYAYSSLLTALVFFLMLRWEVHADEPHSDRYIVLIAYLMGLSIGVHLLNLLAIPAIVLVYYYRKSPAPSAKGVIGSLLVSFVILAAVLYGVIPGSITIASYVELFCVNTLGLPFNSGALFYFALLVAVLIWSIIELYRTNYSPARVKASVMLSFILMGIPFLGGSWVIGLILIAALAAYFIKVKDDINIRLLSTATLSMAMILVGYSCYALLVIRSAANPPMDQNSPDNVFSLKSYLNREQYGDRPLFYGAYYNAEPELVIEGEYCRTKTTEEPGTYVQKEKSISGEKDEYIATPPRVKLVYDKNFMTLFPRMHSSAPAHAKAYEGWVDIEGKMVKYDRCGEVVRIKVPTFGENLEFFFRYQLNYMYWRYFMWNFSGRQNDVQGHGEITNGNWITGISFIDELLVGGDQDKLPPYYSENKGHNAYFMLPLLLGLIGIAYQLAIGKKGKGGFWIVLTLFFMTGIAIVLYLNQGPSEPRERDYAYAGSFYAFAIWVGLGVMGLAKMLRGTKMPGVAAASLACLLALPAPVIMAGENWDDHDRSDRYVVRDFGRNYFNSCAPGAVIFTNGDNDTFPLWYLQETEQDSVSLDKRVCNLSYLQTDWYIEQMIRPAHKSEPLPIAWDRKAYIEGKRDVVYLYDFVKGPIDLKYALDEFLASDDPKTKTDPRTGSYKEFLPCKRFVVPVNVDGLIKQGAVKPEDRDKVATEMVIDLSNRNYLTKSDVMVLDMIANGNWERPLYYAVTVGSEMYMGMQKYFQLEGLTYRLVPYKDAPGGGRVNTDLMYDNMMNKFKFGNVGGDVYIDENVGRMCLAHRQMFDRLIDALIVENKADSAIKALDYCLEMIPGEAVPFDYSSVNFVEYYYVLGQTEKARALSDKISSRAEANLNWFRTIDRNRRSSAMTEIGMDLASIQHLALVAREYDEQEFDKLYKIFEANADLYN